MLSRFFVVTSLLLLVGAPALAQTPGTSTLAITLEEVERRALERNPAVAEARLATDAADYTVAESRTAYTPNLTIRHEPAVADHGQRTSPVATSPITSGEWNSAHLRRSTWCSPKRRSPRVHQATVQAEGAWRNSQVNLKELIVRDTSDPIWTATLLPVERPAEDRAEIDLAAAIANATANRTDLQVARRQQQSSDVTLQLANDQRRPAVDLLLNYGASGVGGTQILRGDVLGSSATGAIPGGDVDALSSLAGMNYPTWSLGLNVTMPIGKKAADAAYARGVVERRQADMRLESLQLRAAADVTRAAQAIRSARRSGRSRGRRASTRGAAPRGRNRTA
jgi:outer membrane protein TolC